MKKRKLRKRKKYKTRNLTVSDLKRFLEEESC